MANLNFDKEITALLVIDPYNDFISEKTPPQKTGQRARIPN